MSAFPKDVYGKMLSMGLRARLFEFDQVLAGEGGCPYRLTPERYGEARAAIATLYTLVKDPDLEISPKQAAADRARSDADFQNFLQQAAKRPRRQRRRPGTA